MKGKRTTTRLILVIGLIFLFIASSLPAKNGVEGIRLFQSYFFDTPISAKPYGEAGLQFDSYDYASIITIGARGGYALNEKIEVQAQWGFVSWSPEVGDGQSGISDLTLYGRYKLSDDNAAMPLSAGAMISLPIGSEDVGGGSLNFGAYGATRKTLDNDIVITGSVALIFYETTTYEEGTITPIDINPVTGEVTGGNYIPGEEKTDYETSFNIGAGVIYPVNDKLHVVGEFNIHTEGKYMMLSGGADYNLGNGRIRGMLGIGLDDGAPDISILGGYAIVLK